MLELQWVSGIVIINYQILYIKIETGCDPLFTCDHLEIVSFVPHSLVLRAHRRNRPVIHTLLPNHVDLCPVFVRRIPKVCKAFLVFLNYIEIWLHFRIENLNSFVCVAFCNHFMLKNMQKIDIFHCFCLTDVFTRFAMLNYPKFRLFVDLHFIISLNSFVDFLYVPSFVRGGRNINLLRSVGQQGGCRPMGRHLWFAVVLLD